MGDTPTLEEFAVEVEAFLAARYPPRTKTATEPFAWGQGSDEVRVFQQPDPDEETLAMPALRAWRKALSDNGLGWVSGPVEYGGRGLPAAYSRTLEHLAQSFVVPGDAALTVSLGMIAPTILRHGGEEQKQKYLPKMYSGELIACQLFSEPDAGSDLASVTTSARPDNEGWRLSGQKVWTSGAHLADFGEIITKTAAGPRHHNLTAFLVDMRASGVEVPPLRQMTGGAWFNEVFLDDVVVSDDDRLGEVDQGWPVALTTLSNERNAMGHSAFGGVGILSTELGMGPMTRVLNPLIRRIAGRRHMNMAAQIYHRGRRIGRPYVTPARARLHGDTFWIPLTFGTGATVGPPWTRAHSQRRDLRCGDEPLH